MAVNPGNVCYREIFVDTVSDVYVNFTELFKKQISIVGKILLGKVNTVVCRKRIMH